jgi:hypothetical protein
MPATITVWKTNAMVALAATVRRISRDSTVTHVVGPGRRLPARKVQRRLVLHEVVGVERDRECGQNADPADDDETERHEDPRGRREGRTQVSGTPDRRHYERRRRDEDRHTGPGRGPQEIALQHGAPRLPSRPRRGRSGEPGEHLRALKTILRDAYANDATDTDLFNHR